MSFAELCARATGSAEQLSNVKLCRVWAELQTFLIQKQSAARSTHDYASKIVEVIVCSLEPIRSIIPWCSFYYRQAF